MKYVSKGNNKNATFFHKTFKILKHNKILFKYYYDSKILRLKKNAYLCIKFEIYQKKQTFHYMNKLIYTIIATISFTLLSSSCGDDKNEQSTPSIEGKWTVDDRILVSDKNDEESIAFTQLVNNQLKINAKSDYRIEKTYIKRGETEEKGLVGDIRTEYTPLKTGFPSISAQTNEFEQKNDSITIYDGNLKNVGYCNVGEKILIIKRKITTTELEPILASIGLSIPDEIPDGYTATYTTYEMR